MGKQNWTAGLRMRRVLSGLGWLLLALATVLVCGVYGLVFGPVLTGCIGVLLLAAERSLRSQPERDKAEKIRRIQQVAVAALIIVLLSLTIVETFIYRAAQQKPLPGRYLIVLGAAVVGDQPSVTLKGRLDAAGAYLLEHPETVAVVSGGLGKGKSHTEAEVMRGYLVAHGIAPQRILEENRSTTTRENLLYSRSVLEQRPDWDGKLLVVTSDYHQFRAQYIAQRLGIEAGGLTVHSGPLLYLSYALREYAAVAKTLLIDR